MKLMFEAETIHGEKVVIVGKEPLGSQGRVLLTSDEGDAYVADLSGLQITPVEEWDNTAEGVSGEALEEAAMGKMHSAPADVREPEAVAPGADSD